MAETFKYAQDAAWPHLKPAKIAESGKRALDFPAPDDNGTACDRPRTACSLGPAVRNNQVDAAPPQPTQRIAVVTAVADDPDRPHPWPTAIITGTRTSASVGSARVTSFGVADVMQSPRGIPSPSANTTAFVPLPILRVLPTPQSSPARRRTSGTPKECLPRRPDCPLPVGHGAVGRVPGNKFSIAAHCRSVSLMRELNRRAGFQRKCLI
jgi:hypothetical protein